jgi:hypothetical protein
MLCSRRKRCCGPRSGGILGGRLSYIGRKVRWIGCIPLLRGRRRSTLSSSSATTPSTVICYQEVSSKLGASKLRKFY